MTDVRILHVVTLVDAANSYGGPLTVAVNQCRELRRRGHEATIVAGWLGSGKPPAELEGVPARLFPVRRVVPGPRFSGLASLAMLRWLRHQAPRVDVAHLHLARDLVPLAAGALLARAGVPYVTQTHGMITPDARRTAALLDVTLTRRVLRGASARFVLTDREHTDLSAVLTPDPPPLTSLPNGVPPSPVQRPDAAPGMPLDVLFLARLHPRKNVLHFAEAAAAVVAELPDVPVRFSVVGTDDGDLARLNAFLAEHPAARRVVTYEGSLPHQAVADRLAAADLYVLPSVDEPFPMSLLEALAAGTPAICTTSCGLAAELGSTGAVSVVDASSAALAARITDLLVDRPQREALAARGRRAVATSFCVEAVAGILEDTYLTARNRAPGYQRT